VTAGVDYNRPREFIPTLHNEKKSHKKTRMRTGYARSGFLLFNLGGASAIARLSVPCKAYENCHHNFWLYDVAIA